MTFRILLAAAGLFMAAPASAQLPFESAQPAGPSKEQAPAAPATSYAAQMIAAADPENILHLDLSTGGRVSIIMRPDAAPAHVERIRLLTRRGFYDGLLFHRVIEGFMAQTGDPRGTGQGGSELPDLKAEFNDLPHVRGAVSMARTSDPDSANSQFFIMFMPMLRLDRQYTVFGRVVDGMRFVDAIERGEPPANPSRILQASIGADNKAPPAFPARLTPAEDALAAEAAKLLQAQPQAQPEAGPQMQPRP